MKATTIHSLLFLPLPLCAEFYHIGTGQENESIAAFTGWTTLQRGDTVFIHYREEPYREHFLLCQSGTPENPITIQGVPDGVFLMEMGGQTEEEFGSTILIRKPQGSRSNTVR